MNEQTVPPSTREGTAVFHRGEVAVQSRAGKAERMQQIGGHVIRAFLPEQHRAFFADLTYLIYGALDAADQPWASLLVGEPEFVHSIDPRRLRIDAIPLPGDPVFQCLSVGSEVGVLGIDLVTRRRNRMNGVAVRVDAKGFEVAVRQSFGNCPKYIQTRALLPRAMPLPAPLVARSEALNAEQRSMIQAADTFFIASHYSDGGARSHGMDVSHRGGKPGFVRANDDGELTWPDFVGNSFFNTLGNLEMNPRCGLLFLNFERGDLLYLAGKAKVIWDGPEVTKFAGAERLVNFSISSVIQASEGMPLRGDLWDVSDFLEDTGTWDPV